MTLIRPFIRTEIPEGLAKEIDNFFRESEKSGREITHRGLILPNADENHNCLPFVLSQDRYQIEKASRDGILEACMFQPASNFTYDVLGISTSESVAFVERTMHHGITMLLPNETGISANVLKLITDTSRPGVYTTSKVLSGTNEGLYEGNYLKSGLVTHWLGKERKVGEPEVRGLIIQRFLRDYK